MAKDLVREHSLNMGGGGPATFKGGSLIFSPVLEGGSLIFSPVFERGGRSFFPHCFQRKLVFAYTFTK